MNKPYHERPDWILKSIVYFCNNYTIDGEDLRKYKRGAIKQCKSITPGEIDEQFSFSATLQGHNFWSCLAYLHGLGYACGGSGPGDCKPWTDYEKRKIAKMPKV